MNKNPLKSFEKSLRMTLDNKRMKTVESLLKKDQGAIFKIALDYYNEINRKKLSFETTTAADLEQKFAHLHDIILKFIKSMREMDDDILQVLDATAEGFAYWSYNINANITDKQRLVLNGMMPKQQANDPLMIAWKRAQIHSWTKINKYSIKFKGSVAIYSKEETGERLDDLKQLSVVFRILSNRFEQLKIKKQPQGKSRISNDPGPCFTLVGKLADLHEELNEYMTHTVPIARAIHQWATGSAPKPASWGESELRRWRKARSAK